MLAKITAGSPHTGREHGCHGRGGSFGRARDGRRARGTGGGALMGYFERALVAAVAIGAGAGFVGALVVLRRRTC